MINIIVDGNYIFHKTFGVFAGYGKDIDPAEKLATHDDQAMFIRKVATDLCFSLNSLPQGGKLIFTVDDRSWRKEYYSGYKSSREEKDENSANWSIFFNLMHDFGKHLEDIGFIFSKSINAEGDDLIWGWNNYFKSIGENMIIVSGDGDLHQLVDMREDGSWTIAWNSKSKNNVMTIDPNWIEKYLTKIQEVSIFNMGSTLDNDKNKLKSLFDKAETNIIERNKFIFLKMLAGDKGDDVPSIWSFVPGPSGRITRVTENKATKIWNLFIESEWRELSFKELLENDSFLEWVSGQAIKSIKGIDNTENREIAKENLIRNFDLMWLDETSYPQYVMEGINSEIDRGIKIGKQNIVLNRNKLLEGTTWSDGDTINNQTSTPSEYNPFRLF